MSFHHLRPTDLQILKDPYKRLVAIEEPSGYIRRFKPLLAFKGLLAVEHTSKALCNGPLTMVF